MTDDLSLPRLQAHLDRLNRAQSLTLARSQIERLLGHNDVAAERLTRFAKGHNCIIAHSDNCVVFEKVGPPRAL
jgi:hypothetical protein